MEIVLSRLQQAGPLVGVSKRSLDLRERAQSAAAYRKFLEAAPDAMVVVNQQGEIFLLNPAAEKLFDYRPDELLGQKVKIIISEGFQEQIMTDRLGSSPEAGAQQAIWFLGRRKDGSVFPAEVAVGRLESPEEVLFIAAVRIVSNRKRMENLLAEKTEEVKRLREEFDQFVYAASHDLQEPLRMVTCYMQLLAKRYKGHLDADADEFISFAVDGAQRMKALLDALLLCSRAGNVSESAIQFSSKQALEEALGNLRPAILRSHAVVTYDELPTVVMDRSQLVQLFENLVGNAIQYRSAAVPHVHISAIEGNGGEWIFAVRDNGLGIEAQHFKRIFVILQRLHGREEFEGAGIGLTICKKIVERHGGRMWVESQVAQGSTFYFALRQPEAK